jgi:integrase/recombinase XerD
VPHAAADHPLILKRPDWPELDRTAWSPLFVEGDILDGAGPCHHWSEGSRKKREQTYGHWLAFCIGHDVSCLSHDVTARATEQTVKAFLEREMARCSLRTVCMHAEDLLFVFRSMAPTKDWKWLARIVRRMRANLGDTGLKPRLPIRAYEMYSWALKRVDNIDRDEKNAPELWRAARFRDALMIGVLITTTLRLRTFIAIDIEKHLSAPLDKIVLNFGPEDMKDRRPHEFELPVRLVEPMRRYLLEYRPILLRGNVSTALWITEYGTSYTYGGFQRRLPVITLNAFGIALRPHAFRTIAATSIATEDPEHANIIADVLRHSTLKMSEKHYNRADGVKANSDLQNVIQERRREAERRDREARRRGRSETFRLRDVDA